MYVRGKIIKIVNLEMKENDVRVGEMEIQVR